MRRRSGEVFRRCFAGAALIVLAGIPAGAEPQPQPGNAQALRWGGDAEGGAPFVEADPRDPAHLEGFDVEIAAMIARALGRTPQFVQILFTDLDLGVRRGDFDIGLSGIEDTPARRASVAATIPYDEFQELLTVRAAAREKFRSFADLGGRRGGTLGGTIAYEALLAAELTHGKRLE